MSVTDIWLLCAPKSATFDVQNFLSQHEICPNWKPQPHTPGTLQTRFQASLSDGEVAQFGSLLSKLGVVFEIYQNSHEPCLLVGHPGLGLKRLAIDLSGEIVLRIGQLERLIREAEGNHKELERLLRFETGTPWLDLLEPYRIASSRVRQLPRAV